MSSWQLKKAAAASKQDERDEEARIESAAKAADMALAKDTSDAALGKGADAVFEKKMSKDEKKAAAAAKRAAKKAAKGGVVEEEVDNGPSAAERLDGIMDNVKGEKDDFGVVTAADLLAEAGTICTFSQTSKGTDDRSKDINVANFTMLHKGTVFLDECDITLNYGNR